MRLRLPTRVRTLSLFVCAVLLGIVCASDPLTGLSQSATERELDRYASGEFDPAVSAIVGNRSLGSVARGFRGDATRWIDRAAADLRISRTQVVAAVAVEVMAASFTRDLSEYMAARDLVEWACVRLRKEDPSQFERWFYLASIALMQGAGDERALAGQQAPSRIMYAGTSPHGWHGAERFPDEPRFKLTELTSLPETQVLATWPLPSGYLLNPLSVTFALDDSNDARVLTETMDRLALLFHEVSVGDEARLRAGVLKFARGLHVAAAGDLLAAIESGDPSIRYVAHIILGAIEEREGRLSDAVAHYQAAHDAVPASASSVALASALYRLGRGDEAARVLAAFDSAPPPPDPWRQYGQRDHRLFGAYRAEMRQAVGR